MFKISVSRKLWFPKVLKDVSEYWFETEITDGISKNIYSIEPRLVCKRPSGNIVVFGSINNRDFSVEVKSGGK